MLIHCVHSARRPDTVWECQAGAPNGHVGLESDIFALFASSLKNRQEN